MEKKRDREKKKKSMNQKASPAEDGKEAPLRKIPFMHETYHVRSSLLPLTPH